MKKPIKKTKKIIKSIIKHIKRPNTAKKNAIMKAAKYGFKGIPKKEAEIIKRESIRTANEWEKNIGTISISDYLKIFEKIKLQLIAEWRIEKAKKLKRKKRLESGKQF